MSADSTLAMLLVILAGVLAATGLFCLYLAFVHLDERDRDRARH